MKKILILFLSFGILSCSPVKIVFDYDKEVDFKEFKSYKYTKDDLEESVGQDNRERILIALEEELSAKGLSMAEESDLLVNAHIKTQQKVDENSASQVGYGSMGWHTSNSSAYMKYDEYIEGTLFITIADRATETIIWQGAGTKIIDEGVSEDKREANIKEIIHQIMENYPYGK